MNKKGATVDNLLAIVTFFGLAIFFLVLLVVWNNLVGLNEDLWEKSEIGTEIRDNTQRAVNQFDFMLVMAYFGIHLGILALAFFLRSHPAMYVVSIIVMAILVIVAAPLSNTYEELVLEPEITSAAESIPVTNYIMHKLPVFEFVWGLITAIILYALARSEGFV